ncbi:molybdopterin-containing oxidoreductase family protein [Mycobacterium sp.]|uniref:molybdopterin-containing oxidoreductase family protein n=1 Tax=Mycobacterium sp. TaxID=1785 RepID=UPI002C8960A9|nr:molybdopterin-dependent oxidoreductase [Mycobacterium sp.]HKP41743.1 molybdopterin-dependent oxidoreductase [Mycobacterium sp.]
MTTLPNQSSKRLFCGLCEASCGLIATVSGDELIALRPDAEHPNSRGFACSKGIAFPSVRTDPDRVLYPLRRRVDGTFERVSWVEALDDIGKRLRAIINEYGTESIGILAGNPVAWNYGGFLNAFGMAAALKTKNFFISASVDVNNYYVVGQLLYGHNLVNPVPDLARTDFFLCLGANPVVSHGSMMNEGRVRERMLAIADRGGRVVVVDPRRTETAELFEHLPIRPNGDVWLLAAMLKVILDRGLQDTAALEQMTRGHDALPELVRAVDLERAARETGIAAECITSLAVDFAAAPSAVVYGRCGASLGPFATLTKYLIDVLNIVTGNLDRPGGWCFGRPWLEVERLTRLLKINGYARWRTRVDGIPEVFGTSPLASLTREILTPGKGQLRAMLVMSSNPVISAPASDEVEHALQKLDLLVSVDPYITDTSRHAHYLLPPTLWLEREGLPIFTQPHAAVPYAQWVSAALPPKGEARDDWWIIDQICKRIGKVPSPAPGAQLMGRLGIRVTPAQSVDILLRLGPEGDLFGLRRRGLSRKKLLATGAGVKLADGLPTGVRTKRVNHKDRRVHVDHPLFKSEIERLLATSDGNDPEYPLRVFSVREFRSHNSWLHNVPKLIAGDRVQRLKIHPNDANTFGIDEGDLVEIASRHGKAEAPAHVTEEVMCGSVGLPQGWGHRGQWRRAVAAGGSVYNRLTANTPAETDVPSGNAVLNGLAVRVRPLRANQERSN